jgi:hypothetical protein
MHRQGPQLREARQLGNEVHLQVRCLSSPAETLSIDTGPRASVCPLTWRSAVHEDITPHLLGYIWTQCRGWRSLRQVRK